MHGLYPDQAIYITHLLEQGLTLSQEHQFYCFLCVRHNKVLNACVSRPPQVYILPTIRINDGQYRGKLSYTEVLRAICAGFTKNAEPKACMRVAVDDSCRDGSVGHSTCAARCAVNLNFEF